MMAYIGDDGGCVGVVVPHREGVGDRGARHGGQGDARGGADPMSVNAVLETRCRQLL